MRGRPQLRLKLGRGPTAWLKVAHLAEHHGVTLAHHEEPHISAQLLSTVGHYTGVELFGEDRDPVWHRLLLAKPHLQDGHIELQDSPGFGLEYDEDILTEFNIP